MRDKRLTIFVSEIAEKELDKMDTALRESFLRHIGKLEDTNPGKHLRFGIPYYVEKVTKSARIIFNIEEGVIYILHCFATHKEYEKWYNSYK